MTAARIDTLLRDRSMHQRQLGLLAMRIDDKSLLEANRDGVTSYEDIETITSGVGRAVNDGL